MRSQRFLAVSALLAAAAVLPSLARASRTPSLAPTSGTSAATQATPANSRGFAGAMARRSRFRGGHFAAARFTRARGMRRGAFGGQGLWLDRIARNPEARQRLGLSDEQARQIESATLDFQKARINSRAQQQIARLQLRDSLTAAQPDEGAIDQQLQSLSALRLAEQKAAVHYRLSLRAMLTPAQRQTLRQLAQRRFAHRGGFAPGGRGRMPRSGRVPPRASGPEN